MGNLKTPKKNSRVSTDSKNSDESKNQGRFIRRLRAVRESLVSDDVLNCDPGDEKLSAKELYHKLLDKKYSKYLKVR